MTPLGISWGTPGFTLKGPDYAQNAATNQELPLGVVSFSSVTDPVTLILRNTSQDRRMAAGLAGVHSTQPSEKLENVRFYLTGDPDTVYTLLEDWPATGCGLELSFDQGRNWTLLSGFDYRGIEAEPGSWITLPGSAVASDAVDGELLAYAPYDRATILVRVRTPAASKMTGLLQYQIGVDYDVV